MTTRNDITRTRVLTRPILMRRCPVKPVQPRNGMHWTRRVLWLLGHVCHLVASAILLFWWHGLLDANIALPLAGLALMVGAWLCHSAARD